MRFIVFCCVFFFFFFGRKSTLAGTSGPLSLSCLRELAHMPTLYTLDPRTQGVNAKLLFFVCYVLRIQVSCETGGIITVYNVPNCLVLVQLLPHSSVWYGRQQELCIELIRKYFTCEGGAFSLYRQCHIRDTTLSSVVQNSISLFACIATVWL